MQIASRQASGGKRWAHMSKRKPGHTACGWREEAKRNVLQKACLLYVQFADLIKETHENHCN